MKKNRKASALIFVVIIVGALGFVMATMIDTSTQESKILQRRVPQIQTQNAVEGVLQYAAGKVKEYFNTQRDPIGYIEENPLELPSSLVAAFSAAGVDPDSLELHVETDDVHSKVYIIPTSSNQDDSYAEKTVTVQTITIYAKATSSDGTEISSHGSVQFLINDTSFLEYAIFYNGDLEFFSATDMDIHGPVHSNSDIYLAATNGSDLTFHEKLSSSANIISGLKSLDDGSGLETAHLSDSHQDDVIVTDSFGNTSDVHNPTGNDEGGPLYRPTLANWDSWMNNRPSAIRAPDTPFYPSGVAPYVPDNPDTLTNELSNDAYELIMPPLPQDTTLGYDPVTEPNKLAVKSGLIIRVSGTAGTETEEPHTRMATIGDTTYYNATNPNYVEDTFQVSAHVILRDGDGNPRYDGDGNLMTNQVPLPSGIFGRPNQDFSAIEGDGEIEPYDIFYAAQVEEGSEGYSEAAAIVDEYAVNNNVYIYGNDGEFATGEDDSYITNGDRPSNTDGEIYNERRRYRYKWDGTTVRYRDDQLIYQYPTGNLEYRVDGTQYYAPQRKKFTVISSYTYETAVTGDAGSEGETITVTTNDLPDGVTDYTINYSTKTINAWDEPNDSWRIVDEWWDSFKWELRDEAPDWYPEAESEEVENASLVLAPDAPPPDEYNSVTAHIAETTDPDTPGAYPKGVEDRDGDGVYERGRFYYQSGSWVELGAWEIGVENEYVVGGLYDTRQNREMDLYYLDVQALKDAIENGSSEWEADEDEEGLSTYNPAEDWNGVLYVEFPIVDADDPSVRDSDKVRAAKYQHVGVAIFNANEVPSPTNPNQDPDIEGDENMGFTFATNAPLYVIGDFNADGDSNTGSATEPEAGEVPALIAADTVTFLSKNWINDYYDYARHQVVEDGETYDFANIDIGSGSGEDLAAINDAYNNDDGTPKISESFYNNTFNRWWNQGKGHRALVDPTAAYYRDNGSISSLKRVERYHDIEISAAVVSGVPPTTPGDSAQTSGGVHNFFRFLEDWEYRSVGLTYRGSILALYEPEVHTAKLPTDINDAMEIYRPPVRNYGYNELFETVVPPGTPTGRTFRTHNLHFISEAEYLEAVPGKETEEEQG